MRTTSLWAVAKRAGTAAASACPASGSAGQAV